MMNDIIIEEYNCFYTSEEGKRKSQIAIANECLVIANAAHILMKRYSKVKIIQL